MKRVISFLTAVLLLVCAITAQVAWASYAQDNIVCVRAEADDDENDCQCVCHTFYSLRDTLLQSFLDKTVNCKALIRAASYVVRLYTWRMLNIRQYCECGSRHY